MNHLQNKPLLITTESGKVLLLNLNTRQFDILFQHPQGESVFGVTNRGNDVFLCGATFIAGGCLSEAHLTNVRMGYTFSAPFRGQLRQIVRWMWTKIGAHERVIPHDKPGFHQMNLYGDHLYVAATTWNEIWIWNSRCNDASYCNPISGTIFTRTMFSAMGDIFTCASIATPVVQAMEGMPNLIWTGTKSNGAP